MTAAVEQQEPAERPLTEVGDLTARSDSAGLAHLAGHVALIGLFGWAVSATELPWRLAPMLGLGVALVFLFAPLHETIHRTAFAHRRLNDAVSVLCGLALVLPPRHFRAFHMAHHRWTQDPARDPELMRPKSANLAGYWISLSGLPYWQVAIGGLLRRAAGRLEDSPFLPPRDRAGVVREARGFLLVYLAVAAAAVVAGSWAPLTYWVVPVALGQPFLRAMLMAEHGGRPQVPDMLANTRTTRAGPVSRFLMWNMNYHAEHHAYPGIPFHALPRLHVRLADRIDAVSPHYPQAHREIRAGLTGRPPAGRPLG